MALINCTKCGHLVSDKARICPNCGCLRDDETTVIAPPFGYSPRPAAPSAAPSVQPVHQPQPKNGGSKALIWLLSIVIIFILGFLAFLFISNNQEKEQLEQKKALAIKKKKIAEKEKQRAEEEKRLADKQLQAEKARLEQEKQARIKAEKQHLVVQVRQKAMNNRSAESGSYYISGTLNGDDVDFNIYVDDNGSVSGSFTNYTIGAGFDVAGTMTANSLSFYSLNNSVTWKFKANRTSGNIFSGTCSSSNITYSMYLNVEHQ